MADTKNIDDLTAVTVPAKVLQECLGVSDRQIRNYAEEGILKRNSHGKYKFLESIKNYITTLKVSKASEKIKTDVFENDLDLNEEKAKHEHLKTMITEIKLQLIKGQVHKSSDVERVITDMFEKFNSKMQALPAKMAPKLQGKDRNAIQEMMKKEIADALIELASYNPADYYSDEHIDIEDTDVLLLGEDDYEK